MKPNLETIKDEIAEYLSNEDFVIFHSTSRAFDTMPIIRWDSELYPEFRQFLDCAMKIGVRLITFHHEQFTSALIEDAYDVLREAELGADEERSYDERLRELRIYEGFTCSIELGFDYDGRLYQYQLSTEWYEELQEMLDELEDSFTDSEAEDGPLGGYFSNN